MRLSFSERMGFKQPRDVIQSQSMDDKLRTALWNSIFLMFFSDFIRYPYIDNISPVQKGYFKVLWMQVLNLNIDEIPYETKNCLKRIKDHYKSYKWYEVYDFIEFLISIYPDEQLIRSINNILKDHLSGYRLISMEIVPIISDHEIASIESALQINNIVSNHINTSLKLLSDKIIPDYRNSIKESISAVEALARLIVANPKTTLGSALTEIEKSGKIEIHKALKDGFLKLYGWTSDDEGIRHSLMDEPSLSLDDAVYKLVSCSAFINYLYLKSLKAGLDVSIK